MPRRRRVDDIMCSITSEHISLEMDNLKPTLDRFAEDTSMLGFRYLHTRYKTWFRVLWAFIIIFFVSLTIYQVSERITYYFIKSPLKTIRTYDTPTELVFPAVVICNKMQLKASKVAAQSSELLRAMCGLYEDDGTLSRNKSARASLHRFNDVKLLDVYSKSFQSVDDFVISCQYEKGKSCVDEVRPILTPKGICFEIAPNLTVRRPGPETTLSLLLNLEVNEMIPGTVREPGVVLSFYDHRESPSSVFSEGIHLEAGKVVTVPINDVRKLYRYRSECGRKEIGSFSKKEYSRAACQWQKNTEYIEKECGCRPVNSPQNRMKVMGDESLQTTKSSKVSKRTNSRRQYPPCTVAEEYGCVHNFTFNFPFASSAECPEDCEDFSFSSVVFGGRIQPSEIESLLPGDWEDEKEKRIRNFQPAFEVIPNHRIPVVRSVQLLANEAQNFVDTTLNYFGVHSVNSSVVPCLQTNGSKTFERIIHQFFLQERIWRNIATYLELVFPYHMDTVLDVLNIELSHTFEVRTSDKMNTVNVEKLTRAVYNLHMLHKSLETPQNLFGIKSIDAYEQNVIVLKLQDLMTSTADCLNTARAKADADSEIDVMECGEVFSNHFRFLTLSSTVSSLNISISSEVEYLASRLLYPVQKMKFVLKPKILEWKDYAINIWKFEQLYKEGGKENQEMHDLMKVRKILNSELTESINSFSRSIDAILQSRRHFFEELSISETENDAIGQLKGVQKCLLDTIPQIENIRRSPFIRAEWLSRVQRQIEQAQAYSPGQQYDKVNLLNVKIYFSHFKQELIKQEKSYNLFLLLAEIGGTIGLYVGATLLTVAETLVFFIEKRTRKLFVKPQYC